MRSKSSENSDYEMAHGQCLEELLNAPNPAGPEEFIFDLYLPVRAR